MSISVNQGGTWKNGKLMYVRDGGTWHSVVTAHVKVAGTWQLFYPTPPGSVVYGTAGTFNFTVPAGITNVSLTGVGGGGGGCGVHDSGYCESWGAGGPGGGVLNAQLAVLPGDVIQVRVGSGGGAGGYQTCGGAGTGTTFKYNGVVVVNCYAGPNASSAYGGSVGGKGKVSAPATGGTIIQAASSGAGSGCDGGCGTYDWYSAYNMGCAGISAGGGQAIVPPAGVSHPTLAGRAQFHGWAKISWT